MFYILDIIDGCADYNFISMLVILKKILFMMQVIMPIILLASCIFGLIKMLINPDDKKGLVGMRNKVMAALIFIFLPFLVNLVLMWTEDSFSVNACWQTADEYKAQLDDTEAYDVKTSTGKKKKVQKGEQDYIFNGKTEDSSGDGTATGKAIVDYALQFVGKKYVWGGGHNNEDSLEEIYARGGGVDCSGFVRLVYKHFGYTVNGTTWEQLNAGRQISYSEAQAGDLIVYSGHVAIFMGDGDKIVHASNSRPYPSGGIKVGNAKYKNILSVRRII